MNQNVIGELTAAIDEAETEFEGKVRAFDDYTQDEIADQRRGFADAREWLNAMSNAPALITAAPQMLAALEVALRRLEINDCEGEEAEHMDTISAAIALATSSPTGEAEPVGATGQVWLSTIERRGEPRMSWEPTEEAMRLNVLEYCNECLELDLDAGSDLEDMQEALRRKENQYLYWERAQ